MGHKPLLILPIVGATAAFITTATFNVFAATGTGGVFRNTTREISDKFNLEITPAGFTFSIWSVIYSWQLLFLGYGISTIFRRGPNDDYIYCDMKWQPFYIYLIYILNMGLNITWIFMWDRQILPASFVLLFLIAFTLYVVSVISCRLVANSSSDYMDAGMEYEIWLVRFLVHNAFGIYGTWTTIATLLNFGSMLSYHGNLNVDQSTSSTVVLSLLTVEALVYSCADFIFLDKYTRYLFTPYLVVPFALSGSLAKNWTPGKRNSIFTAVLISIAGVLLLTKVFLMIWRTIKYPFYQEYQVNKIMDSMDNKNVKDKEDAL